MNVRTVSERVKMTSIAFGGFFGGLFFGYCIGAGIMLSLLYGAFGMICGLAMAEE